MRDDANNISDFRVYARSEIQALIQSFIDSSQLVTITTPRGVTYTTTIWSMDESRGSLGFSADASDPRISMLLDAHEAMAVGYLDCIKVQFDVHAMVLVRGQSGSVLNCEFPHEVYRLQRRQSYRVKPILFSTPCAKITAADSSHTAPLTLRILDVSLGGVALHLPEGLTEIKPGTTLEDVRIHLDADTHLQTPLHVQHATVGCHNHTGALIGCAFEKLSIDDHQALQHYINQTQKRLRMLSRSA